MGLERSSAAVAIVAGLSLSSPPALALQVPRFPSAVELVELSVLVRGSEGPIRDLRAADFEVRDNGVVQEVELALTEALPLEVVLALDVSGSVAGAKLRALKQASHALVDGLRPPDRAALVTFAEMLRLRSPASGDFATLRARIDELQGEGGTSLVDGAFAAMLLAQGSGRALAIVFTDGQETVSWLQAKDVLAAAERTDAVVYVVRIGDEGKGFLRPIATATGGRLLGLPSSERLREAFLEILGEFRARYVLRYAPKGVERGGFHRLAVRLKSRSARVLARKGYRVGR